MNLRILIASGKQWLQSSSANIDVRMVPVHHRNSLYLVGNNSKEGDQDLLQCGTFVWSENIDGVLSQFVSLLSFCYDIKWPKLKPFLDKTQDVYNITLENHSDKEVEEIEAITAVKLVNTSLIFGFLTEILLEEPTVPNGPNVIYKYLAGSTVKWNQKKGITLKHHNDISKNANALLRLLRHGICSLYVRKADIMTIKKESHHSFENWANNIIKQIQVCHSIGHICRTIRTAREVDRKTPSLVHKAFNDITGELLVGGCQIHKSSWSVAIPTAIYEWDIYLTSLFPNHSHHSNLPLHWMFNINNNIVLAGTDSLLSVGDYPEESIPLS